MSPRPRQPEPQRQAIARGIRIHSCSQPNELHMPPPDLARGEQRPEQNAAVFAKGSRTGSANAGATARETLRRTSYWDGGSSTRGDIAGRAFKGCFSSGSLTSLAFWL